MLSSIPSLFGVGEATATKLLQLLLILLSFFPSFFLPFLHSLGQQGERERELRVFWRERRVYFETRGEREEPATVRGRWGCRPRWNYLNAPTKEVHFHLCPCINFMPKPRAMAMDFPPFLLTNREVVIKVFLLPSHLQTFLKPSQGPLYFFDSSRPIRKGSKNVCRKTAKENLQFSREKIYFFPLFVFLLFFGFSPQHFFLFYRQIFMKPPMIFFFYFLDYSKSSRKGLKTACQ